MPPIFQGSIIELPGEPYLCGSPVLVCAMPEIAFLDPDDAEAAAWDDLWQRAPQRTPFTHRAFARAMAAATGRPLRLVAVADGSRLVAGCVLASRARGRLAGPAPLMRYTGVLLDPVPSEGQLIQRNTALDTLLEHVTRAYPVATLSLTPDFADARPFVWSGFSCAPHYTYRIGPDPSYQPDKATRRRVRQMPEASIATTAPDDEAFVALLLRHYRERGQSPPVPPPALASLMRDLQQAGLLEAMALRDATAEMVAAQALLIQDDAVFTWMAGSSPGPAMTVLQDHLIRTALEAGRSVDLLGANIPAIAAFKLHYGGALTVHYHAVHYRSRVLRALGTLRPLA